MMLEAKEALSPPLGDKAQVPNDQETDGSQSSPSEESEDSGEHEGITIPVSPLFRCSRCGREWDGNAQCSPCIDGDEEEDECAEPWRK